MKKTLITLVITGIVSSMLIGCSQGTEGNAANAETPAAPGAATPDAGAAAPAGGGPATPATGA